MSPTVTILLLWLAFAGAHLVFSSLPIRQRIIGGIGEDRFRGLYSLLVLGLFVPLVWFYGHHKHAGVWLWTLPHGPALRAVMYVGMAVAFVLAVAGFARPSPGSIIPGDPRPRGIQRVTRHPAMMAIALFGLLHLLPNSSTADVAFFGGFVVFPLIGSWHQDRRKLALATPGYREFYDATPFFPFTGRATWEGLRELAPTMAALGIALAIVVRYFHASWFGG